MFKNKQMEKLFNVPVELFQLDKLVLQNNKTAKVDFTITDDRGDKTLEFSAKNMHPNYQTTIALQEKLNELKPYAMKIRGNSESDHSEVSVKGVIWSGTGDKENFKILSNKLSASEQVMNNDTCKLHVVDNEFGFESEVRDIIIELESLAHGYIFENKMAEITMGLTPIDDGEEYEEVEDVEEVETEE